MLICDKILELIFLELFLNNSTKYFIGYGDAFEEFIENNRDNKLPNQSSGSFLNGLIDLDGLLYSM